MRIGETVEDVVFRAEARAWLEASIPRERRPHRTGDAQRAYDVAWRRRQFDAGWGHIAWPERYGGRGLPLSRQLIWYEESARAGAPDHTGNSFFVALQHAGPTLIARATEDQQTFHLPRILRGDAIWCQGFSEPGAGSDLAGIRTRGVVEGDEIVVTGQKIWTSYALYASYQELLIRTEPGSRRHRGLTFVICDMSLPGIDVRPIRNIAGGTDFCEVFYDEVRMPVSSVVGGLGNGWDVAMSLLSFERGAASFPVAIETARRIDELIDYARAALPALDGSALGERLAQARADAAALQAMVHLLIARDSAPAEGSYIRLCLAELGRRASALAMDVLGPEALDREAFDEWPRRYLEDFKLTIAAGTSQIQRNIIGERVLGLPRQGKAA
ncbi:acyl-CoA dehydrogenase family protein [uncultured Sphingomonas sp.]|uniref:acyl-CoA dehydrogenase family protein n=1 Tax=uncultured Sphingomonas sp. TaxID=158754 RepID=UPI0035CB0F02